MKNPYTAQIEELDKTLRMLSESQIDAKPEARGKWAERIDSMLDERKRLMDLRDGKTQPINPS